MNISVVYFSRRKELRILAQVVGEVCGEKEIDMTTPHNLGPTDLLFIGVDEKSGKTDQAVITYLNMLPANTIKGAAIFSVSKDGKDYTEFVERQLIHKGIAIFPKNLVIQSKTIFSKLSEEDIEKTKKYTRKVLKAFNG